MQYKLPHIPPCKFYYNAQNCPEHDVVIKCMNVGIELDESEIGVMKEAIKFYEEAFAALKEIPLSHISMEDAEDLVQYLNLVFSMGFPVSFDLEIKDVYRVTVVKSDFLERGKVRNPKFLSFPPVSLLQSMKWFNRANSFNSTVLYAAFKEDVALRETKAPVGSRVIVTRWQPKKAGTFNAHPITNSGIENNRVQNTTSEFRKAIAVYHPLFARILDINLSFLASEYVKDVPILSPNRLEYLYSAYFSDRTLKLNSKTVDMQDFDLIIYPSVAFKHKEDNIAIHPNAVERLKIVHAAEYLVEEANYSKTDDNEAPVKLHFLRESNWITQDQILWEDD